jgi:hypothetical protein
LEVPVTIHSAAEPVFDVTVSDVQIQIVKTGEIISPVTVALDVDSQIPNKPWYYKTFRFTFPINRHTTDDFLLVFPKPINGCPVSTARYKKDSRTHWATPTL